MLGVSPNIFEVGIVAGTATTACGTHALLFYIWNGLKPDESLEKCMQKICETI
jgi:hypothetical protein